MAWRRRTRRCRRCRAPRVGRAAPGRPRWTRPSTKTTIAVTADISAANCPSESGPAIGADCSRNTGQCDEGGEGRTRRSRSGARWLPERALVWAPRERASVRRSWPAGVDDMSSVSFYRCTTGESGSSLRGRCGSVKRARWTPRAGRPALAARVSRRAHPLRMSVVVSGETRRACCRMRSRSVGQTSSGRRS